VGHLLRFPEAEVEVWSYPLPRQAKVPQQRLAGKTLPKSLIE
jgi:hypothetical protein